MAEDTAIGKQKKCGKCGGVAFRRVNRETYMEENILPKFGIFPWECVICRVRRYYRDDGHRPTSPETKEMMKAARERNTRG